MVKLFIKTLLVSGILLNTCLGGFYRVPMRVDDQLYASAILLNLRSHAYDVSLDEYGRDQEDEWSVALVRVLNAVIDQDLGSFLELSPFGDFEDANSHYEMYRKVIGDGSDLTVVRRYFLGDLCYYVLGNALSDDGEGTFLPVLLRKSETDVIGQNFSMISDPVVGIVTSLSRGLSLNRDSYSVSREDLDLEGYKKSTLIAGDESDSGFVSIFYKIEDVIFPFQSGDLLAQFPARFVYLMADVKYHADLLQSGNTEKLLETFTERDRERANSFFSNNGPGGLKKDFTHGSQLVGILESDPVYLLLFQDLSQESTGAVNLKPVTFIRKGGDFFRSNFYTQTNFDNFLKISGILK
jgi:hypothetical protein